MKTTTTFIKKPLVVAIGAAIAGASPMAIAQSVDTDEGFFEEIIVTATARESSMQDIPYNISAMSGDALERQNIVDQAEVLRTMHGITVVDRGYRNGGTVNSIVIRGLNVDNGANSDIMLNAVPTVATYYDNTPLFANFLVKDIERVEVLRGPQGTLYGSGSLGGTVRYIGNKPNAEEFEAKFDVDYGQVSGSDGNNMAFDAMVNIPMGENAALRAVYSRIDNDGMIDYVNAYQLNSFREPLINVNGNCVDPRAATDAQIMNNVGCFETVKDADFVKIDYAKVSLRVEPSDSFSLQLNYLTQDDNIGARRATTLGDNGQTPGDPLYFSYGDLESGQVLLEPSSREADLISLDLEWDLGFATFTSSSSLYDHEGGGESDNGGLWASGGRDWNFNFYGGGWPRPAQRAERGYDDEAFIQEIRLVSNDTDGNVDWLVGGYYMDQENSVYQLSYNPGMNLFHGACVDTGGPACGGFWPAVWYPGIELTEIDFEYIRDTSYKEKALYGEVTFHVSDAFRLTGGLRYFDNKTVNDVVLGFPLGEGWTSPMAPQSTDSDSDVLVKLNASWDLNDSTMLYATYSEGYRHGGAQSLPSVDAGDPFGEPNVESLRTFQSDSVKNFELGVKGGGDNMRYTASLFNVDWDNPQLNTTSAWWGFYVAANGDKASTQGIELELEGRLADSFHYRVGYTHVKAELDKDFLSPQTGAVVAPKGSTLPGAPSDTLSFSLDNSWEINSDMDLIAGFNAYYQSDSENFINQASALNETYGSFTLLNATLSLSTDSWTAMLYAKNLADEAGATGGFAATDWSYDTGEFENWYGNGNRQFIVQPRTIGLKFGYRF
ncbi:MAG: TonB-dependent receptor [Desulfobulbaceae bacterium]|nr:TonB-dependent receptor [Desulfobulbaceae bacterium]